MNLQPFVCTNHAAGIGQAHGIGATEWEARVLGGGGLTKGLEETISLRWLAK